ncbi:hypothetical protein A9Q74_11095 [Colwellia sp. 39_35_sub15_T18]|nr:hypothetical protein A9Q74_11095 [Colwellia sp. 39_35_sub15_T18]
MNNEDLKQEENQLRQQISSLSLAQKRQYYSQELQQIKDPDTYAALNWAFVAGLHHFYLGKWQRGLANVLFMFVGIIFYFSNIFSPLGLALILVVFAVELPQLFNSQKIIYHYNNQIMRRLLQQFDH